MLEIGLSDLQELKLERESISKRIKKRLVKAVSEAKFNALITVELLTYLNQKTTLCIVTFPELDAECKMDVMTFLVEATQERNTKKLLKRIRGAICVHIHRHGRFHKLDAWASILKKVDRCITEQEENLLEEMVDTADHTDKILPKCFKHHEDAPMTLRVKWKCR